MMIRSTIKRETVDAKAFRLRTKVQWLTTTTANVHGDHGQYLVERLNTDWRCDCRWGTKRTPDRKPCSHVLAAMLAMPAPQPAPIYRQPIEQSVGNCACPSVRREELYFNNCAAAVIHRTCGTTWSGAA